MKHKAILLASALLGSGLFLLSGQQPAPPAIFTPAQAAAGRTIYENTCGQCHTPTLLGRKGDPGELPALTSLSPYYQKFIGPRGFVPPLTGPIFIDHWGSATAGRLIARFQETVDFFHLQTDQETTVNITAYVLQVNGAKPGTQPLTRSTDVVVASTLPER